MADILLIEDDEAVCFALKLAIQGMGHVVDCAGDGREGCAMATDKPYDLIVTDIIMPHKGGVETIRDLKADTPNLKIVVITGGGPGIDMDEISRNADLDGFLAKPFSNEELEDAIATALIG